METPVVRTGQKNYHDTLDESIIKMKLAFGNASLPEIFVVMVTVGYTLEKIAALNAELAQLEDLYQDQILALAELLNNREDLRKETADAQKATDARDSAFDALYPKYAEYIKYAKILLPNNQLLEALGIRVR